MINNHDMSGNSSRHQISPEMGLLFHGFIENVHRINLKLLQVTLSFAFYASCNVHIQFKSNGLIQERFNRQFQIFCSHFNPSVCTRRINLSRLLFVFLIQENLNLFEHFDFIQDIFFKTLHLCVGLNVNLHDILWIIRLEAG